MKEEKQEVTVAEEKESKEKTSSGDPTLTIDAKMAKELDERVEKMNARLDELSRQNQEDMANLETSNASLKTQIKGILIKLTAFSQRRQTVVSPATAP